MYLINKTRLTPAGAEVTLIREADITGVCIIHNGKEMHSCRAKNLTDTKHVAEEEVKEMKIDLFNQI